MNIFLPYEKDVKRSVQAIDDKRLNKQIVEVYTLLEIAIDEQQNGERKGRGYHNHPIYKHYKNNIPFLAWFGLECCNEWALRGFYSFRCEKSLFEKYYQGEVDFVPFYASGSKNSKECIRTTENVGELYKKRLLEKWHNDIAKENPNPPKWCGDEELYWHFIRLWA